MSLRDRVRATAADVIIELIGEILSRGHRISIFDGEEYPVRRSRDRAEILKSLGHTDEEFIVIRGFSDKNWLGQIDLVWCNDEDVISDHTDNPVITPIVDTVLVRLGMKSL